MLPAKNRTPRTIETYLDGVTRLGVFLAAEGMPQSLGALRREHVEAYIASVLAGVDGRTGRKMKPSTAASRYRSMQAFFKWLVGVVQALKTLGLADRFALDVNK